MSNFKNNNKISNFASFLDVSTAIRVITLLITTMGVSNKEVSSEEATQPSHVVLKGKIWQIANAVMSLFFFVCAVLQHNDSDPELWMVCA